MRFPNLVRSGIIFSRVCKSINTKKFLNTKKQNKNNFKWKNTCLMRIWSEYVHATQSKKGVGAFQIYIRTTFFYIGRIMKKLADDCDYSPCPPLAYTLTYSMWYWVTYLENILVPVFVCGVRSSNKHPFCWLFATKTPISLPNQVQSSSLNWSSSFLINTIPLNFMPWGHF